MIKLLGGLSIGMNRYGHKQWCQKSGGEFGRYMDDQHGSVGRCEVDGMEVEHYGDTMRIEPMGDSMISAIEGPSDEFFTMGRPLATEVGDHAIVFQE